MDLVLIRFSIRIPSSELIYTIVNRVRCNGLDQLRNNGRPVSDPSRWRCGVFPQKVFIERISNRYILYPRMFFGRIP